MATNILENCTFSNDKIDKLWIGSMKSNGNSINYPIEFTTVSGTTDSVLSVQFDEELQTFTIGGQTILVNEIVNLGDNIEFVEELEYGSQGKIYLKRIRFNIPNVNLQITNQIKEFVMNSDGSLALANTIAFLLDENGQTLCVGYDKPLVLRELNTDIGDDNGYELVYESRSPSRSRAYQIMT